MPLLQVKAFLNLFIFHVSLSFFEMVFMIGKGFETQFVPLPFCDPLWVLQFWLRLGSSLFVLPFPFVGCFV